MIISLLFLLLISITINIVTIVFYYKGLLSNYDYAWFGESGEDDLMKRIIIIWISLFLNFFLLLMDFNLTSLHIYLMCKGITTYQYIVLLRKKKLDKEN